jgi:CheY-like chemotaxis protein
VKTSLLASQARPFPHHFPSSFLNLQPRQDEESWSDKPPMEEAHHDSLRILIVNEDMRSATTLKQTLCALGYTATLVAYSGKRALAAVAAFSPALAIVDLELADMTGYSLARQFRAHDAAQVRALPLIAVAEHSEFATGDRVRAAGFLGLLTKPVPSWLLSRLLLRSLM